MGDVAINSSTHYHDSWISTDDHKLILGTSISGGVVLLCFLVYVAWQMSKGRHLVDILKLRRRPPPQWADEDDRNPFAEMRDIQKTQRYSVRSHRFSSRLSTYSLWGTKAKAKHSALPTKSPLGYTSDWQLPPPKTAKAKTDTKAMPHVVATHVHFIKLADDKTTITKPDMAQTVRSIDALEIDSKDTERLAEEQQSAIVSRKLAKAKSDRKPNGRVQKPSPLLLSVRQASSEDTTHRFSISTNPDCPPTPKFKLERTDTADGLSSTIRMERIDEASSPRSSLGGDKLRRSFSDRKYNPRSQTDSVTTLSAIIQNYSKAKTSPREDVEMGFKHEA